MPADEAPARKRYEPVPATLIGGFLGSGKTTLLNRILAGEHGRRVAVLVNDFGDVSIDAELIEAADETSVTLTNGCICCSIKDDLLGAVQRLLRREPPPEQLVVELSGIADPGSVLRTFALMERRWPLFVDGVVLVVDSEQFPEPDEPHFTLAREQLVLADVVLLNKLDLVTAARVAELRSKIVEWVPTARVVETVRAEVPLELLLGLGPELTRDLEEHPSAPLVSATPHGFSTFTYRSSALLSLAKLRAACTELPSAVFRAKGFVYLDARPDHRTRLQIVGRRARIDLGEPWAGRKPETVLVFIGGAAGFDPASLAASFAACGADPGTRPSLLGAAVEWLRGKLLER